jgi:hypothetical protein
MQFGGVFMQSYIRMGQFSPVAMINNSRNDLPHVWKFLYSPITIPVEMFPKKNTAITEKMKSTRSKSRKTFANAPTDIVMVCIRA